MKKRFVYGILAALTVCSCQVEEINETTPESTPEVIREAKVFTAIIDDTTSPETRTSLDAEGNVLWKQGDQVSIFAGSTVNEQYQVTDASDGKTAASLNKVGDSGFVAGTEIDNNVAFYPYASTAAIAKSAGSYVISDITLPATQTYAEGSFGNGAFPMAAVTGSTGDMNLKFKNVLGGLKLQLKGTASIASISITGNNNEVLCGAAEVIVANGSTPSINLTDASSKTVTLDCGAGVALDSETATPFIIALPPITMTGGFTVIVTDTEGKQMEIKTTKSQTITRSSLLRMPAVNYVGTEVVDYSSQPFTITSIGSTSVSITEVGSSSIIGTLKYKLGDGEWTSYTFGSTIDLEDGIALQFKRKSGTGGFSSSSSNYKKVVVDGSGTVIVSGNIMSLTDESLEKLTLSSYIFYKLFEDCTKLTSAANLILPATTLASFCYNQMFRGCASLTTAPKELPATTLQNYCYGSMFYDCTSLTKAPELPATTLANNCCFNMFCNCSSLTTAPELPATTLAMYCYNQMFYCCTSLTTAPELPATTLDSHCYDNMFYGCTSLTTAPELPATTLASNCYNQMFSGCTSLTTAPELPATTLADYCYCYMFSGCTSLSTAPKGLPATTLQNYCYYGMFQGCTSLTTAPELPATTLVSGCYGNMFYGCSNLNFIKALFTTGVPNYWVFGVSDTGTFVKSKDATWDITGHSGIPSGWTIITE